MLPDDVVGGTHFRKSGVCTQWLTAVLHLFLCALVTWNLHISLLIMAEGQVMGPHSLGYSSLLSGQWSV